MIVRMNIECDKIYDIRLTELGAPGYLELCLGHPIDQQQATWKEIKITYERFPEDLILCNDYFILSIKTLFLVEQLSQLTQTSKC